MIPHRHPFVLAGLLASALASSAFAQAPQGPLTAPTPPAAEANASGTQGPRIQPRHTEAERAAHIERMKARHAERQAQLKEKLRLAPAQDAAWNSFAAAHQPPARDALRPRMDRADMAKLTTPERLDRMQARQAERSARMTQRADATRAFYAALTPEQRKTFDAEMSQRMSRGPGMHRAGHGPHGGPGEGAHRMGPAAS